MKIPFQVYFLAFTLFIGLVRLPRIRPLPARLLIPLLAASLVAELTSTFRWFGLNGGNVPVMNIFILLELYLTGLLFYHSVISRRHQKIVVVSTVAATAVWLFDLFDAHGLDRFYFHAYTGFLFSYICWCLLFFKELFTDRPLEPLARMPLFWISTGFYFYSLGMFLSFVAFIHIGLKPNPRYQLLWDNLTNILNTILYGCFLVSFFCGRQRQDV